MTAAELEQNVMDEVCMALEKVNLPRPASMEDSSVVLMTLGRVVASYFMGHTHMPFLPELVREGGEVALKALEEWRGAVSQRN